MSMRLPAWYFGTGGDCKMFERNGDEPDDDTESSSEYTPMLLARFKRRGTKRDPVELALLADEASSLVRVMILVMRVSTDRKYPKDRTA
jgi:hypothetical protein